MNNLAISYSALGRHREALKLREETLALRKTKLGPDHPNTLWSMTTSHICLAASRRYFEEPLALNPIRSA